MVRRRRALTVALLSGGTCFRHGACRNRSARRDSAVAGPPNVRMMDNTPAVVE